MSCFRLTCPRQFTHTLIHGFSPLLRVHAFAYMLIDELRYFEPQDLRW